MARPLPNQVLIYGAGDFGRLIRNILRHSDFSFAGFISDLQTGPEVLGPFESVRNRCDPGEYAVVIGVGYADLKNRWTLFERVKACGYQVPALVHPRACVCESARVAEGCILMAGALVDFNSRLQELVVLWPGSIVSHDSAIGQNTFLSPGAIVCGFSEVGSNCFVGAGATVVDRLKVPDNSFIKAGRLFTSKTNPSSLPA
jgi:sugar O-acyltransferase (sialic acid O-acetyltransferase NeuD family)